MHACDVLQSISASLCVWIYVSTCWFTNRSPPTTLEYMHLKARAQELTKKEADWTRKLEIAMAEHSRVAALQSATCPDSPLAAAIADQSI